MHWTGQVVENVEIARCYALHSMVSLWERTGKALVRKRELSLPVQVQGNQGPTVRRLHLDERI